ncbi:hypothetical protein FPV67DRAFT_1677894 [Lyophyllum atratum]|nr:hypothetical protein FPV67DRAFT_1677894 [Lyophyllum atratum]
MIYHPSHFNELSPGADLDVLLTFISGILRLSTKYIILELRRRCITLLVARFPTSYQGYLASPKPFTPSTGSTSPDHGDTSVSSTITFSLVPSPNGTQPDTSTASQPQPQPLLSRSSSQRHNHRHRHSHRHSTPHHHHHQAHTQTPDRSNSNPNLPPKPKFSSIMRAIAFGTENNVPTILPYASYLLARTSSPRRFLPPRSLLFWHQKTIILVGRTHLHAAQAALSHAFLASFEPSSACASPGTCKATLGPMVECALLLGVDGRGPDPLRPWKRWEKLGVCRKCVHARGRYGRGREGVWERLP